MAEREGAAGTVAGFPDVPAFVRGIGFEQLPDAVVASARHSLLDLIGVAAAGSRTRVAAIASAYAATQLCGSDYNARILFDGRRSGLAGAAFAGASTIDALDGHDGHVLTKGHAGAALLPALLALCDAAGPGEVPSAGTGREFLTRLVLGYEIAIRAGIALHASVPDYHCSGAWNALGCAAIAARHFGFDAATTRHALGIAEYFGPRGQILRACAVPTMVKDGSGWGAQAGVTGALLARDGFTGAPALTLESNDVQAFWNDLGTRWRICEQYFKPYPVCRWAQPAVEAALELQRAHGFAAEAIATIAIESFREAVALGSQCAAPSTTEEAQYSIAFPVAAALVFRHVGAGEVDARGLSEAGVQRLLPCITLCEDPEFSRRFPAERWARVRVGLVDGRSFISEPARARGNPENPLSEYELRAKYREFATPVLGAERTARIERAVNALAAGEDVLQTLLALLLSSTR
jgi:2-methylcitrate dehydratase PrpD